MTAYSEGMPIVVFDTNVIEGRYITPLLKGEPCRDFESLRDAGYWPALHVKSFYEVCNHMEYAETIDFRGWTPSLAFPVVSRKGKRNCPRIAGFVDRTQHLLDVGICEEWRLLSRMTRIRNVWAYRFFPERDAVREEIKVSSAIRRLEIRADRYCELIWETLSREMKIITCNDLFGEDPMRVRKIWRWSKNSP